MVKVDANITLYKCKKISLLLKNVFIKELKNTGWCFIWCFILCAAHRKSTKKKTFIKKTNKKALNENEISEYLNHVAYEWCLTLTLY